MTALKHVFTLLFLVLFGGIHSAQAKLCHSIFNDHEVININSLITLNTRYRRLELSGLLSGPLRNHKNNLEKRLRQLDESVKANSDQEQPSNHKVFTGPVSGEYGELEFIEQQVKLGNHVKILKAHPKKKNIIADFIINNDITVELKTITLFSYSQIKYIFTPSGPILWLQPYSKLAKNHELHLKGVLNKISSPLEKASYQLERTLLENLGYKGVVLMTRGQIQREKDQGPLNGVIYLKINLQQLSTHLDEAQALDYQQFLDNVEQKIKTEFSTGNSSYLKGIIVEVLSAERTDHITLARDELGTLVTSSPMIDTLIKGVVAQENTTPTEPLKAQEYQNRVTSVTLENKSEPPLKTSDSEEVFLLNPRGGLEKVGEKSDRQFSLNLTLEDHLYSSKYVLQEITNLIAALKKFYSVDPKSIALTLHKNRALNKEQREAYKSLLLEEKFEELKEIIFSSN